MLPRIRSPLLVVSALVVLAGCDSQPTQPNVLLISIDTLRADHLGFLGYPRETSPALDELASESIVFQNAFSPAPRTLPSHVMMLTGSHPYELGITRAGERFTIPTDTRIVSEHLKNAGYQTVAFVDSSPTGWIGSERGFARGFDEYHHAPHREGQFYRFDVAGTVDAGLEWIEQRNTSRPFFMFLHTKSVHAVRWDLPRPDDRFFPYEQPEPYRLRFVPEEKAQFKWRSEELGAGTLYLNNLNEEYFYGTEDPEDFPEDHMEVLKGLYDSGIYYTDHHLGRLFEDMRKAGLMDDTLVIVTSDHGEAFLEHGFLKHGSTVYSEMLHVPLILRLPAAAQRRFVEEAVSIGDITATILDLVGIPISPELDGPLLTGDFPSAEPDRPQFAFIKHRLTPATGYAIRRGDWRLIYDLTRDNQNLEAKLYHVSEDLRELNPVEGEDERTAEMLEELLAWRALREEIIVEENEFEIDEETLEHLKAVGYIE